MKLTINRDDIRNIILTLIDNGYAIKILRSQINDDEVVIEILEKVEVIKNKEKEINLFEEEE